MEILDDSAATLFVSVVGWTLTVQRWKLQVTRLLHEYFVAIGISYAFLGRRVLCNPQMVIGLEAVREGEIVELVLRMGRWRIIQLIKTFTYSGTPLLWFRPVQAFVYQNGGSVTILRSHVIVLQGL